MPQPTPSVVLVTGVSRIPRRSPRRPAGGQPGHRPGARRGHRPAAARPAAPDGARRVRPRRHPQPAHRQGHLPRRRSTPSCTRRCRPTPAPSGGRTAMKEMNVIGTMQLLAACQKAPSVRRVVLKSTTAVYGSSPRDPALFDEAMTPEGPPVRRLRQGRRRDRGLPARVRPPPAGRLGHRAALRQLHRPAHRHRVHPLLRAAGGAHRARLRRPRAAAARGGRAGRAGAGRHATSCPACSTSPPTACCCCPRPSAGPAGSPLPVPSSAVGPVSRVFRGARIVDFSPEQMRLLNFGRVVDTARLRDRVRLHPALDHHPGLRRLRARPGAAPGARARSGSRPSSAACSRRRGRCGEPRRPAAATRGMRRTPRRQPGRRCAGAHGGARSAAEARVIPLHADDAGARPPLAPRRPAGRRPVRARRAGRRARARARGAGRPAGVGGRARRGPRVPAPPPRRATTRSTTSASTPTSPTTCCCPRCARSTERWFRVETIGMHHVPDDGGALVVANHSGHAAAGRADDRRRRCTTTTRRSGTCGMLGADLMFRLPGGRRRWPARRGATLACNPDAERLMSSGELVGVWPEGFKGIGKPFRDRYKLQRFGRGGFVSAALRTGVPIIPCSIVGAEEIYPKIGDIKPLARLFGAPYFPITPTFPLLGPLGLVPLPSKWYIEFGEPIRTDDHRPGRRRRPDAVFNLTDQVRETIQHTLYRLLSPAPQRLPRASGRLSASGRRRRPRPPRRALPRRAPTGRRSGRPCGRCGSRGSASRGPWRRRAARSPG